MLRVFSKRFIRTCSICRYSTRNSNSSSGKIPPNPTESDGADALYVMVAICFGLLGGTFVSHTIANVLEDKEIFIPMEYGDD